MNYQLSKRQILNFWKKVEINNGTSGCWLWNGNITTDKGNGSRCPQFWLSNPNNNDGQKVSARRLSYLVHFGTMPEGEALIPSCGNDLCVNPSHLIPTLGHTQKVYKTKSERVKITEDIVKKIITLRKLGKTIAAIARKLNVNPPTVLYTIKLAKMCKQGKLEPYQVKTKLKKDWWNINRVDKRYPNMN